jgi:hypothetical protein
MVEESSVQSIGSNEVPFDADTVFLMINDPVRRSVIHGLAHGQYVVLSTLSAGAGSSRSNYLKHITALCDAGVIVRKENPKNVRQPLFALSPKAVVCKSGDRLTIDFGCYTLRF